MKFLSRFFTKPPKIKKHFLAVDIGTDFVKAFIFELGEGEVSLLGYGKHPQGLADMKAGVISNISAVEENIEMAINEAGLTSEIKPQEVIFGVSGEMCKGLTTTVRMTRKDKEEPLNEKELKEIEKKVQDAAFIESTKEVAETTGNPDLEIELITSRINKFKVDGYEVTNPLDFKGKTLEISIFTAYCPKLHLANILKMAKNLNLRIITISPLFYSFVQTLSFGEPTEFNALILDIGGETTDIAVVFGGGIISTKTLPVGGRLFTRALAEKFDLSFSQAEVLKLNYIRAEVEMDKIGKIKEALAPVLKLWLSGLQLSLGEFTGIKTFPTKIILGGGGSALPEIKEVLIANPWTQRFPFAHFPKINVVKKEDLLRIKDKIGKLSDPGDFLSSSLGVIGLEVVEEKNGSVAFGR